MSEINSKIIFISGISRGLGRATAHLAAMRGHQVMGTVRNEADIRVADQINQSVSETGGKGSATAMLFDVTDNPGQEVIQALQRADILINNSGIGADIFFPHIKLSNVDTQLLEQAIAVNSLAPLRLMNIAMPAMRARGWGRVVNVSSALARMQGPVGETLAPAYRMSKTLLNSITAIAAMEYFGSGVLINALCPGWCKTEMGREMAPETPEQGAERILRVAFIPDEGPTGAFFIDNEPSSF